VPGDAVVVGVFVREDEAVVVGDGAESADHDVRHREAVAPPVVDHAHRPGAGVPLTAESLGLKGPSAVEAVARVVAAGIGDELAHRAPGRGEVDLDVADPGGREGDLHRRPLDDEVEAGGGREGAAVRVAVRNDHRGVQHVDDIDALVAADLRWGAGEPPGLRQPNGREGVDEAVAVVVAEVLPAAVPGARAVPVPGETLVARRAAADLRADVAGGDGEDRLHVAPA
jgi:hypothetical protein